MKVIELFMNDPIRILVKKDELTLEGIKQFYIAVDEEDLNIKLKLIIIDYITKHNHIKQITEQLHK